MHSVQTAIIECVSGDNSGGDRVYATLFLKPQLKEDGHVALEMTVEILKC